MWPFQKKSDPTGRSWTNTSPIEKWGGSYFYPTNLVSSLFQEKTFEAFNKVPEVNAVLNYRANAKKNVNIRAISKTNDQDSTAPNARKALKLLNNPNYFQDGKEFLRQSSLWHDIDGNEYLYFQKAIGFKTTNSRQLFTLPPQNVDIHLLNTGPFFFLDDRNIELNYSVRIDQTEIKLPSDNIVHLNDNRVNVNTSKNDSILKGESKLKALSGPINNIIAAYKARNIFLEHRGALGLLTNSTKDATGGTMPLDPKEREKVQAEYRRYGVQPGQFPVIITDMSLNWQQMAVDLEKLRVFEEVEADFFKICDSFGISNQLFSTNRGVTFNNKKEAKKEFYQDTIIPEFNEWIGAVNQFFGTENEGWKLIGDYSHLPIFQDNIKERSQSLQTIVNALSRALADQAISIEQYQAELQKFGI
jgi:phage portal protein BeeE